MIKTIFIRNRKGLKMSIRLNVNDKNTKLVFLEHGLSSRKEYPHMQVLEEVFSEYGYNVINMDATNSINESESSDEGITTTGHYEDLVDVIEWAKTQAFYKEPFALAGQSLGAISVVRYAGQYSDKVNLLIPCAFPYYNYVEEELNDFAKEVVKNGYCDKISKSTGKVLRLKTAYVEDIKKLDISSQIKMIKANTYVIVGSKDNEKHLKNSKLLYQMLNCKKEFYLLEDIPHDLANTPHDKELFTKTLREILTKYNK